MNDYEINKLAQQEDKYWWNVLRKNLIKFTISKYISASKSLDILDLGCGPGGTTSILTEFGNVTGADTSQAALNNLTKLYPNIKTVQCNLDGTTLPFNASSFDLVTAFDVLEHIEQDTNVLTEINRILKPNGYVLITVPAHPFLWSYRDVDLMHKRRYTKNELAQKVSNSGFEIICINWFNFLMFLAILVALKLSVKSKTDGYVPSGNKILLLIVKLETWLFKHFKFSIGVSLIALARKI